MALLGLIRKCSECGRITLASKLDTDFRCADCSKLAARRRQEKIHTDYKAVHSDANVLCQKSEDTSNANHLDVTIKKTIEIEIGEDGSISACRAENERLNIEKAQEDKQKHIAAEISQQKRYHFCRKCHRNALEVELPEYDRVCAECRTKYPYMRNPLCATSPTYQNFYFINLDFVRQCRRRFISFDLETTGLESWRDKIIEISATIFENFEPVARFSSLVNPECPIPGRASSVNGIFDADVADAPFIYEAIEKFCAFIGDDALHGELPMVAHNAIFDGKFLLHAFSDCGIEANILLLDTLYISRWMNQDLSNHKLSTVAAHYGVDQQEAHRAADDARVCGEIFAKMLLTRETRLLEKKAQLLPTELAICEWLKTEIENEGLNTQFLTVKLAKTYCAIKCVSEVLRIKARGKRPYILVSDECPIPSGLETAPATKSEGDNNKRVFFMTIEDIYPLRDYFIGCYKKALAYTAEKASKSNKDFQLLSENAAHEISL